MSFNTHEHLMCVKKCLDLKSDICKGNTVDSINLAMIDSNKRMMPVIERITYPIFSEAMFNIKWKD